MLLLPYLFFLSSWFTLLHPFFVSMTEIEYKEKEKQLQISVRIFTDDLEKELAENCKCKVDLSEESRHKAMEPILDHYLAKVLKINVDGKRLKPSWVGFEKEEESTWCYLEVEELIKVESLQVENHILFQTQPKQVNLVRFKKAGNDQTRQLIYPKSVVRF